MQKLLVNLAVLSAGVALLFAAPAAHAQTYDAVSDFSIRNNPNGVWSYGSTPTRGGAYTNYTVAAPFDTGLETWSNDASSLASPPYVMHNTTANSITYISFTLPTDLLNLHPGENGENTVVRWTAPTTNTYSLKGLFQGLDSTTTDVSILKNSASVLFSNDIVGYGDKQTFNLNNLALNSGDTIDFSVGFGNGSYGNDSTGLSAIITTSAVPEPGNIALLVGMAVPGVTLLWRYRRARR